MKRDALHDYRPDPTFEIKSHLSTGVASSTDDLVLANMDLLKRGHGILDYFHVDFSTTEIKDVEGDIPCWDERSGWKALPVHEKREAIMKDATWEDVIRVLKAHCTWDFSDVVKAEKLKPQASTLKVSATETKQVDIEPTETNIFHADDYKKTRLYVEKAYRLCLSWFLVKDYFHDGKEIRLIDKTVKKPEGDLKKVMVAFVIYRNYYCNGMLLKLRQGDPANGLGPLNITHKMVGSIELNSDYDVTVGGPDDLPAAYEFHRAFAEEWKVEACKLFDTNLYYRDWMVVLEQKMIPSLRQAPWSNRQTDPSIQVQVLDFIGDIYSLVKIRRYTTSAEWAALVEATSSNVEVPGFASAKEIPRFNRLELVDQIYRTQFCEPLLARIQDVRQKWEASKVGKEIKKAGKIPKDSTDLLRLLTEFDKDSVLRAMRIAYIELGAKLRQEEAAIRDPNSEKYKGTYMWRQNDDWGAVIPVEAPWNLQGMIAFQERSSLLLSEAVLFANEAYNTQGSLWTIVGGQGGAAPENMNLEHYLQSFNEQVGDALKELQEYLSEIEHEVGEIQKIRKDVADTAEKLEAAFIEADDDVWKENEYDTLEATINDFRARFEEYENTQIQTKVKTAERIMLTGFYRASKYGGRMREMLQRMVDNLNSDPAVVRRIQIMRKLFPGKNNPDSQDLMLLTKECLMASFLDKYTQQLLLIRKGTKDAYFDYQPRMYEYQDLDALRGTLDRALSFYGRMSRKVKELEADAATGDQDKKKLYEAEKKQYEQLLQPHEAVLGTLMVKRKCIVKGRVIEAVHDIMKAVQADADFKMFRDNKERSIAEVTIKGEHAPDPAVAGPVKGLRDLIKYTLWHCAMVNKLYRKIRSRGPIDLYVRNFTE